jgi:putative ribosome biogenesis GTPase RsgA
MFHTYTSGGGGLFADSPGFSQASLAKVMRATLRELFPEVRARQEASASTGGCSFANCLHIGEPCFAIGSDWEHDCLWSRENHKGHLKADFLTSYIIAEHIVFSYHFLYSCNYS